MLSHISHKSKRMPISKSHHVQRDLQVCRFFFLGRSDSRIIIVGHYEFAAVLDLLARVLRMEAGRVCLLYRCSTDFEMANNCAAFLKDIPPATASIARVNSSGWYLAIFAFQE